VPKIKYKELAAALRQDFGNDVANLDDLTLAQNWVNDNPDKADLIEFNVESPPTKRTGNLMEDLKSAPPLPRTKVAFQRGGVEVPFIPQQFGFQGGEMVQPARPGIDESSLESPFVQVDSEPVIGRGTEILPTKFSNTIEGRNILDFTAGKKDLKSIEDYFKNIAKEGALGSESDFGEEMRLANTIRVSEAFAADDYNENYPDAPLSFDGIKASLSNPEFANERNAAIDNINSTISKANWYGAMDLQDEYNQYAELANQLQADFDAKFGDFERSYAGYEQSVKKYGIPEAQGRLAEIDERVRQQAKELDETNFFGKASLAASRFISGGGYLLSDFAGALGATDIADKMKSSMMDNLLATKDPRLAVFKAPYDPKAGQFVEGGLLSANTLGFVFEQGLNMIPSIVAAATPYGRLGQLAVGSIGTAALTYDEYSAEIDQAALQAGAKIDPQTRAILSAVGAAKTGLIENAIPINRFFKNGMSKAFSENAMKALASGKSLDFAIKAGTQGMKAFGLTSGVEVAEELLDQGVQESINASITNQFPELKGQPQFEEKGLEDYAGIAVNTLVAVAPLGGVGFAYSGSRLKEDLFHNVARNNKVEVTLDLFEQNKDKFKDSQYKKNVDRLSLIGNIYSQIPEDIDDVSARKIADKMLEIESINSKMDKNTPQAIRERNTAKIDKINQEISSIFSEAEMSRPAVTEAPEEAFPTIELQIPESDQNVLNAVSERIEPIIAPLAQRMTNAEEIDMAEIEAVAEQMIDEQSRILESESLSEAERQNLSDLIESQIDNLLNYEFATTTITEQAGQGIEVKGVVRAAKPGLPQKISAERFHGATITDPKTGEKRIVVLRRVPITQSRSGLVYQLAPKSFSGKLLSSPESRQVVSEEESKSTPFSNMEYVSSVFDDAGRFMGVVLRDAKTGEEIQLDNAFVPGARSTQGETMGWNDLALDIAIAESQRQIGTVPEGAFIRTIQRVVPVEQVKKIFPNLRETGTAPEAVGVQPQTEQDVRQETNVTQERGDEGEASSRLPQEEGRQEGQVTPAVEGEAQASPTAKKPVQEKQDVKKAIESLKETLKSLKAKPGGRANIDLTFGVVPITKAVWNTAIDTAILAIDAGQTIAQAVKAASDYISSQIQGDWGKGKVSQYLEDALNITQDRIRSRVSLEPLPEALEIIDGFYSVVERKVLDTLQEKQSATKWINALGKGDEVTYTGLGGWLASKKPDEQVSKREILDWMKNNRIEVKVRVMGKTRYSEDPTLQLEGEKENYQEVLVMLPSKSSSLDDTSMDLYGIPFSQLRTEFPNGYESREQRVRDVNERMIQSGEGGEQFKSTHFNDPNILVHLRMNTRVDADGNKVLFLEEIQSDWGQKGKREGFYNANEVAELVAKQRQLDSIERIADYNLRKAINKIRETNSNASVAEELEKGNAEITALYNESRTAFKNAKNVSDKINEIRGMRLIGGDKNVPSAPFVTDTNAWTKLGLKIALKEAVRQGADKIAWTTGEQQNERYNLKKALNYLDYWKNDNGTYGVTLGFKKPQEFTKPSELTEKKLNDYFGKEIAAKIISDTSSPTEDNPKRLEGDDLAVGGKGMKAFYGSPTEGGLGIVGDVAKSLVKQDVGTIRINKYNDSNIRVVEDSGLWYVVQEEPNGDLSQTIFDTKAEANEHAKSLIDGTAQYSIDITPEVKAQVEAGIPLFDESPTPKTERVARLRPEITSAVEKAQEKPTTQPDTQAKSVKSSAQKAAKSFSNWVKGGESRGLGIANLPEQDAERFKKFTEDVGELISALINNGVTRASTALGMIKPYFAENGPQFSKYASRFFKDEFNLAIIDKYPNLYKKAQGLEKKLEKALTQKEKLLAKDVEEARNNIIEKIKLRLNPSSWSKAKSGILAKAKLTNESISELKLYSEIFNDESLSQMDGKELKALYNEINSIFKSGARSQSATNKILSNHNKSLKERSIIAISNSLGTSEKVNDYKSAEEKSKRPGVTFYIIDNESGQIQEVEGKSISEWKDFFESNSYSVIAIDTNRNTLRNKSLLGRFGKFASKLKFDHLFDTRNIVAVFSNNDESYDFFEKNFIDLIWKADFNRDELKQQIGRFDKISEKLKNAGFNIDISKKVKSIVLRIGDVYAEGTNEDGLTIGQIIDTFMMLRDPDALVRAGGEGLVNYNKEDIDSIIDYVLNDEGLMMAVSEITQAYQDFLNEQILPTLTNYGYSTISFDPKQYNKNSSFSKNPNENARAIEILNKVYSNNIPQSIPYSPLSIVGDDAMIDESIDVLSSPNKDGVMSVMSNNVISRGDGGQIVFSNVAYKYNNYMDGMIDMVTRMPLLNNAKAMFGKEQMTLIKNKYGEAGANSIKSNVQRVVTNKSSKIETKIIGEGVANWVNRSVLGQMWFNTRAALFQPIATLNFAPLAPSIGKYLSSVKSMNWISTTKEIQSMSWVKERFGGRIFSIDARELERRTKDGQIDIFSLVDKMLKIGYTPTAVFDFLSIVIGGGPLYDSIKNERYKEYIKTMDESSARIAAQNDASFELYKATNASQQSGNNMLISNAQRNPLLRLLMSYQTASQQMMRGAILSAQLLSKGIGDPARHAYIMLQFGLISTALFTLVSRTPELVYGALGFGDDDEDKDLKKSKRQKESESKYYTELLSGFFSGFGVPGNLMFAVGIKPFITDSFDQEKYDEVSAMEKFNMAVEKLSDYISAGAPGLSIKFRQLRDSAESFDEGEILRGIANAGSALGGIPLARLFEIFDQFAEAATRDYNAMERTLRATDIFNKSWSEKHYQEQVLKGKIEPKTKIEKDEIQKSNIKELNSMMKDLGFRAARQTGAERDKSLDKVKRYTDYAAREYSMTQDQYEGLVKSFNKGYFTGQVPDEFLDFARLSSESKVKAIAKKINSIDGLKERSNYIIRLDSANVGNDILSESEIEKVRNLLDDK
jgi:hypothetical protein